MVVFDLDGTLVNKDTFRSFLLFVGKRRFNIFNFILRKFQLDIISIFYKLGLISNDRLKFKGVALFLLDISYDELDIYCLQFTKSVTFNHIYYNIFKFERDCVVVTASFDVYVKYLLPDIPIICSCLKFDSNVVKGMDFNCYGENKLKALKNLGEISISKFFTDSYSDQPLISNSSTTFIVKNGRIITCLSEININEDSNF
jgi:phosphoserine phosphatase